MVSFLTPSASQSTKKNAESSESDESVCFDGFSDIRVGLAFDYYSNLTECFELYEETNSYADCKCTKYNEVMDL